MKSLSLPPDPALLESMRSIGYTIEAAVADVIDNSVAAGAEKVSVLFSSAGPFEIAILDDGYGMDRDEAIQAMRLAGSSPRTSRSPDDLGRFGLGLKTASLSQCRVLTVLSKKDGLLTAVRWSLDHVISTGGWELLELAQDEAQSLLGRSQLDAFTQGTLVHWGNLDQLMMTAGQSQADLDTVAKRVRDHIALVFHLFNSGEGARRITFDLNGGAIDPIDPFLSGNRLTQSTPWESIEVEGQTIRLMAYTLPYLNRLSAAERRRALRLGGLRETEGFYVYRGGRLVIWGSWFRVMPRSEMAKLTRVRVDIPNSLDHLWALDVKKSVAEPPPLVRRRLSQLAKTMMQPSQKAQKFLGRRVQTSPTMQHMWDLVVNGEEFRYKVNAEHPLIRSFREGLSDDNQKLFGLLLQDLQNTFPVVDAHNRMSDDSVPARPPQDPELLQRAVEGWALMRVHGVDREAFILNVCASEPYCLIPDLEKHLRKVLPQ